MTGKMSTDLKSLIKKLKAKGIEINAVNVFKNSDSKLLLEYIIFENKTAKEILDKNNEW